MLDIVLLGCGGMMPLENRFLTSMVCRHKGKLTLIDCGEGTQVTLKSSGFGFKNIQTICFTHTHADHIAGLPGLLLTIANSDKTDDLTIIGPVGIEYIVQSLLVIARDLPYNINFVEVQNNEIMQYKTNTGLVINTLPADHRIQCIGYSLTLERSGKFNVDKATENNIPREIWGKLQNNEYVIFNDIKYYQNQATDEARKGLKVCYITDSRPYEDIEKYVNEADLFICEGLYGEDDKIDRVVEKKHMNFSEACTIAKNANVKKLWLTHYSPALKDPEIYIEEMQKIFPYVEAGYDRKMITLYYS